MKKELDEVRDANDRGFSISLEEQQSIDTWMRQHIKSHENNKAHSHFTYQFSPTPLGILGQVYCQECMSRARQEAYEEMDKTLPRYHAQNFDILKEKVEKYNNARFIFRDLV